MGRQWREGEAILGVVGREEMVDREDLVGDWGVRDVGGVAGGPPWPRARAGRRRRLGVARRDLNPARPCRPAGDRSLPDADPRSGAHAGGPGKRATGDRAAFEAAMAADMRG